MQLTIVIVLYKKDFTNSQTMVSLYDNLLKYDKYTDMYSILIYDNSPIRHDVPNEFRKYNIHYVHDQTNSGLAHAYNIALTMAESNNCKWIMLLDQDTSLNKSFFEQVFHYINFKTDEKVAALVPKILSNNKIVSPIYNKGKKWSMNKKIEKGIIDEPIMAINSGSVINVSFMRKIGGFNLEFPLDYLDHWIYKMIYKEHFKVFVMDVLLLHDLSVMNYNNISITRYISILNSEIRFYLKYTNYSEIKKYKYKLLLRFLKQLLLVKNKQISLYTLRKSIQLFKNEVKI
ncbi:glycosyltransferase [Bacillus alveayuensis]|uniref:glycosyltransferase n=1 Tax=Aeribacillus alveayuensis TaxID=279215 RepID=UPI0005CCAC86|nr:glycosyltransferase [Bacillus alveayuensis]